MKALLYSILVASLMCYFAALAGAQAPAPAAVSAPAAPALDELEQAWVQTLRVAQARATEACAQLVQAKDFDAIRSSTVQKIEARRPGYTLGPDLAKPALVKKETTR
jgi:hypothetical protein